MSLLPSPAHVRLSGPLDLVEAVPHLLGFRPARSVVAIGVVASGEDEGDDAGPSARRRIAFTVRVDLPPAGGEAPVADVVARAMRRQRVDGAYVVVFADADADADADAPPDLPVAPALPHAATVEAVRARLHVDVLEAVLVVGDRVWCYGCDGCCPPEGRLRDPDSPAAVAIAAAHALLGERVLASRAEVVRSVQPIGGIAALSVRQAIVRVLGRLTGEEEARAAVVEDARACFADLTVRFWSPPATVEHDEAALVGVGLVDVRFRDEVLCGLVDEPAAALPLLLALARLVPPAFDAPICTVLGCAAYLAGDGVLATTAFERALSSDRDYSLARLTMRLLAAGVPPDELAAEWRAAAPEVARLAARVRRAPGRTPP